VIGESDSMWKGRTGNAKINLLSAICYFIRA